MRIRSKLVVLIAVPLIALTLVAGFGFSNQSVIIETAEDSVTGVAEARAVQQAVLAVSNERILRVAGAGPEQITEAGEVTDASLLTLNSVSSSDSEVSTSAVRVASLVSDARLSNDRIAVDLYGSVIGRLLSLEVYSSERYPTAATATSASANQTAVRALQLQEWAWIAYFGLEGRNLQFNTDVVASVYSDFATAETTLQQAVALAGAEGADEYNAVLQSGTALSLNQTKIQALDDLAEGSVTVSSDQVLGDLVAFRTQWAKTIEDQSNALQAVVDARLTDANNLRSLFTLLAVLASAVLAGLVFVMYRAITGPLQSLLERASLVADVELPTLMSALRHGDSQENLPVVEPIPVTTTDEIGELVEAFNDVQTTAYELATEQALSRKNVADMFVNLGRRNQQLLQRILGQLTDLEQHEEDPDKLAELFELDNIVTRMRRNAESLLALAGAQTARQWSQPIEMENTIRAAFAEVEGYERIDVATLDDTMVAGRVVSDITHLLAELLENAINFSEPTTIVEVNGQKVTDGYLITVSDQGIGMSHAELIENNSRITDPPPLDQVPTRFLGLYVVGRLAERHGIEVRLTDDQLYGTSARVLLPAELLDSGNTIADIQVIEDDDSIEVAEHVEAEPAGSYEPAEAYVPDQVDEADGVDEADEAGWDDEVGGDDEVAEHDLAPVGHQDEPAPEYVAEEALNSVPKYSPLEEKHDLEAELAELTGDSAPAATSDLGALPTRSPGESQEADASSDWVGLPVRNKGDALASSGEPEPLRSAARDRAPAETSEAAASDFSSMLSAFSSGINQGLEASEEDATKGEDS